MAWTTLPLSATQRKAYEALIVSHHSIEVGLTVMDLAHNQLSSVSKRLLDGQVTFDATQDITRGLQLDLLDPSGALHLDSNSPDAGALFADRMIQVRYTIINPAGTVRYGNNVFTGPITKLDRSGAALSLECLGKEIFGMSRAWNEKTYKKGEKVTGAIRSILVDIIGENKLSIPNLSAKLPRNVSVGGDKLPWPTAKQLAASIGYQLYYDGSGIARMRKMPSGASVWTFRGESGGSIKSEPEIGFDIDNVINAVEVWGKKPEKPKKGKTAKKRPHYRVVAARSHPLSPWNLGGSGASGQRKPRYLPDVIEDDSITTDSEAKARGNKRLASGLLESVEVKFDSLVLPQLEENDVVRVATDNFATNFRLRQFALPLTAGAQMSVGYVKNVKPNKSAIRARSARRK